MSKIYLLLLVIGNMTFAASHEMELEKDGSGVLFDLRKTPKPFTQYCAPRLRAEPSQFTTLRKQALSNIMTNAFTAAFDQPDLVFNDRCTATMNTFGHFMYGKRTAENPGRLKGFLGEALVGEMGPYVSIIDKNGNKHEVMVNCAEVMSEIYPEFFDTSEKATKKLVQSMIQNRNEMKKMLNDSLQGQMEILNYPKAVVQDVAQDPEDSTCVKVKAYSAKESGGYGYGRVFRFCEDSEKSTCGNYYGEGVDKLIEQNEARNNEMMRKRDATYKNLQKNENKPSKSEGPASVE